MEAVSSTSQSATVAAAGSSGSSAPAGKPKRRTSERRLQQELRAMMYGFGDVEEPLAQSMELMEDMIIDYVQLLLKKALAACEDRHRGVKRPGAAEAKIKERDLLFALRKDRKRCARVAELLEVWQEQKAATSGKAAEEYANDSD